MTSEHSASLSEVLGLIKDTVGALFAESIWLRAEVLQIGVGRHRYLELIEYDQNRVEVAKGRGTIWESNTIILDRFFKATGAPLEKGMKILFKARPTYHPLYGLSFDIKEIDPAFTLGDMQARINQIRALLKSKGSWGLNKALASPRDFTRIAVIAPPAAAGLGDFRIGADKLQSLGLCEFDYFHSAFQGQNVDNSLIEQMVLVLSKHKESPYDSCVLIRGGGDKAGLYQLNDRRITEAICRFPLPVMVGIGHDRDHTLLDEVANLSFATPSLLGAHICTTIISNAQKAKSVHQRLVSLGRLVHARSTSDSEMLAERLSRGAIRQVEQAMTHVASARLAIQSGVDRAVTRARAEGVITAEKMRFRANTLISRQRDQVADVHGGLQSGSRHSIQLARREVERKLAILTSVNPSAILARGYGLLQSSSGAVRSVACIQAGDQLRVKLSDGTLKVEVQEIECE